MMKLEVVPFLLNGVQQSCICPGCKGKSVIVVSEGQYKGYIICDANQSHIMANLAMDKQED